jgi:hypothetical protein
LALFFTTDGMVYKLKTWRLPLAGRTAKGKAIVNILPIETGVSIAALMPVDVPEEDWATLQIVFATSDGDVRQNDCRDFTNVKRNGKIAMNLPEGITLVNAAIADDQDDVMLVTEAGPRHPLLHNRDPRLQIARLHRRARHPPGRGDRVVSMSIIRHFDATPEEREAYLKQRRLMAGITEDDTDDEEEHVPAGQLSPERYAQMSAAEDLILTVTKGGSGKLSSSHDYPVRGRGGMGVKAISPARAAAASSPPSRSNLPTRSCWPPPPASRSACRWTRSASARAAPGASRSSTSAATKRWFPSPASPTRVKMRLEDRLAALAAAGETITYGQLARDLGLRMAELTTQLEALMEEDAALGKPFRAALLRQRLSPEGLPAPGFFQKAFELGHATLDPVAFTAEQRRRLQS